MTDPTPVSDPAPRGRAADRESAGGAGAGGAGAGGAGAGGAGAGGRGAGGRGAGGRARAVLGMLLAACTGSADVLAFFDLGHAFGGIVTGNLITAGYGIAGGDTALIKPTVTAVAGCIAGEVIWAWLLRRPAAALPLLITELALFLGVLAGWLVAGSRPAGGGALALLALVAVALGGQSIWALRIHQTTTYFTGMLTRSVSAAAGGSPASVVTSVRQLATLLAGAILGGVALHSARPAAPAVPLVLLASAAVVHLLQARRRRLLGAPAHRRGWTGRLRSTGRTCSASCSPGWSTTT